MPSEITDSDVSWLLEQEGLNQYQQKAYKALLLLKSSTAAEIASKSGVPEAKLYEVLRSLEARGLAGSTVSRPKKFFLQRPEQAFHSSVQKREESLQKERGLLQALARVAAEKPREEAITLLRGRDVVLRHLVAYMKESVSKTCDACFPFSNAYNPMTNAIKEKAEEGVRIRLLGQVTSDNYAIVKKYLKWGAEVRNCRKIAPPDPLRFSVYDNRASNFTLTDAERDYVTIWTDSEPVVRSIADLFTYYWTNGLKIE